MPYKNYYQSGQALLITLLVLSIAATVVLSIIGRTTTDVAISNQIAESSQAFSAAEAGIEEVLKTGIGTGGAKTLSAGLTYTANPADIGGAAGAYVFPGRTGLSTGETLWLVEHNADGSLAESPTYTSPSIEICWSSETITPAIIVSVLYKSAGSYKVARGAYDPDPIRVITNKFTSPTATSGGCGEGTATSYRQTLTFANFSPAINPASDILLALRIQPVYADTQIAINASGLIPLQGSRIESSGTTGAGITRKVIVFQEYRSPPTIFDSVIYSQGNFGH